MILFQVKGVLLILRKQKKLLIMLSHRVEQDGELLTAEEEQTGIG